MSAAQLLKAPPALPSTPRKGRRSQTPPRRTLAPSRPAESNGAGEQVAGFVRAAGPATRTSRRLDKGKRSKSTRLIVDAATKNSRLPAAERQQKQVWTVEDQAASVIQAHFRGRQSRAQTAALVAESETSEDVVPASKEARMHVRNEIRSMRAHVHRRGRRYLDRKNSSIDESELVHLTADERRAAQHVGSKNQRETIATLLNRELGADEPEEFEAVRQFFEEGPAEKNVAASTGGARDRRMELLCKMVRLVRSAADGHAVMHMPVDTDAVAVSSVTDSMVNRMVSSGSLNSSQRETVISSLASRYTEDGERTTVQGRIIVRLVGTDLTAGGDYKSTECPTALFGFAKLTTAASESPRTRQEDELQRLFEQLDADDNKALDRKELIEMIKGQLRRNSQRGQNSEPADSTIEHTAIQKAEEILAEVAKSSPPALCCRGLEIDFNKFLRLWRRETVTSSFVFLLIQHMPQSATQAAMPGAADGLGWILRDGGAYMRDDLHKATSCNAVESVIEKHLSDTLVDIWQPVLTELCRTVGTATVQFRQAGRKTEMIRSQDCKPGRGRTLTVENKPIEYIATHSGEPGDLFREAYDDDHFASQLRTGRVVWTERVRDSRGYWQDRQQANAALKADANALIIVSENDELFTPERIDPACTIPIIGVRKKTIEILEAHKNGTVTLSVKGGDKNFENHLTEILTVLPPDALVKKRPLGKNKRGQTVFGKDMPLRALGMNPLLKWRLLADDLGQRLGSPVISALACVDAEALRGTEVKDRSLELANYIFDAVVRLAPTRQHFIGFWLRCWSVNFDSLGVALQRHNWTLARSLMEALRAATEKAAIDTAERIKKHAEWRDHIIPGSRVQRTISKDEVGVIRSRVANDQGEIKVTWSSGSSEWVHLSQLCEADTPEQEPEQEPEPEPEPEKDLQAAAQEELREAFAAGNILEKETVDLVRARDNLAAAESLVLHAQTAEERVQAAKEVAAATAALEKEEADVAAAQRIAVKETTEAQTALEQLVASEPSPQSVAHASHNRRWGILRDMRATGRLQDHLDELRIELADPPTETTTMTLSLAPNMVNNYKLMYKSELASLCTQLLDEHGIVAASYVPVVEYVDFCGAGMLSAGDKELMPSHVKDHGQKQEKRSGIDWTTYLSHTQYTRNAFDREGHSGGEAYHGADDRVECMPQVLGFRAAARASNAGLLHQLCRDEVPIDVFGTAAAQILIHHKWQAFGYDTFRREVLVFFLRLGSWQLLTFLLAKHGSDAVVDLYTTQPWRVAGGAVLAASSMSLASTLAWKVLPLAPRSPRYIVSGWRISWLAWHTIQGWEIDLQRGVGRSPPAMLLGVMSSVFDSHQVIALLFYFVVILPTYYLIALTAHLGPMVGACFTLGATLEGILQFDLQPSRGLPGEGLKQDPDDPWNPHSAQSAGACAIAVLLAVSWRTVVQEMRQLKGANIIDHYKDIWDATDLITMVLCVLVSIFALTGQEPATTSQLAAVNTYLLWFRMVQILSGFDKTAKYVSMFFTVTADMSSFLVMIIIFIVGNGFALMLLFPTYLTTAPASEWNPLDPQGVRALVDTLPRALFTSFNMMMGDFDAEILNDAYMPGLAWSMFYLYVLVVNIVMLNLLIALMGGSYERVEEYSKLETLKNRAKLILEYEKNMPDEELQSDVLNPRYLHILVPKLAGAFGGEGSASEEAGVVNGVKRLFAQHLKDQQKEEATTRQKMVEMQGRIDEVEQKMEKKMDDILAMLHTLSSRQITHARRDEPSQQRF